MLTLSHKILPHNVGMFERCDPLNWKKLFKSFLVDRKIHDNKIYTCFLVRYASKPIGSTFCISIIKFLYFFALLVNDKQLISIFWRQFYSPVVKLNTFLDIDRIWKWFHNKSSLLEILILTRDMFYIALIKPTFWWWLFWENLLLKMSNDGRNDMTPNMFVS